MKTYRLFLILSSVVLAFGCGGGSGDAGTIDPSGAPAVSASFAPESEPVDNGVSMSRSNGSGDLVTIDINVTEVTDLYGAAFEVVYDRDATEYLGYAPGTVLEQETTTPNYTVGNVEEGPSGRIVVGASRTGELGTYVEGTKPLIRLTFRVHQTGSYPIRIENASLLDSSAQPQPLDSISWSAGSLTGS